MLITKHHEKTVAMVTYYVTEKTITFSPMFENDQRNREVPLIEQRRSDEKC